MDRLRGLAVLLMIADHVASVAGAGGLWRLGPTRLALPLFVFSAAVVPRSWSVRSMVRLGALVVVESVLNPVIPLGWPGPVLLIVAALLVLDGPWLSSRPGRTSWLVLMTLGLLQALYWPVPGVGWTGYEPGLVLVWCGIGSMVGRRPVDDLGRELPEIFEVVGRRPAAWYVGHLLALAGWAVIV